ncbi:MAG: MATE family efflux transporter [Clostridiales bacterium]|nr:MATE family efflux transporter [Clostridiales bacterium]MDY3747579.1 MATE family efflux transporter [Lachnospiraceae bacterium]
MRKYIGNRQFYKMVLAVAVPIMIQNGITNFVSLLDNIMVGQIGTVQMSGVAIANNLIFVYNICIFGAVSGAGIFGAQFYGNGSHDGVRHTLRFKLIICAILFAAALLIFIFGGDALISLYLKGSGSAEDISATFGYGRNYLDIMLIGFIPFTIAFVYASTLRECGETFVPMVAGVVAVVINLVFNYILIFGHFGAPKMGVAGAAIATVISRFVECLIVLIWTHRHTERNPFIVGLYKSLKIPGKLVLQIIKKGSPLMINEALWSAGMAILLQCYSYRGLDVVAGQNISSTVANVFNVVFLALGNSVGIIIGQLLGAGKMEEAVDKNRKLIFFAVSVCFVIGTAMVFAAPVFPKLYNTTDSVRSLAASFIIVEAVFMPVNSFIHASYFAMRSGGKTIITFLFDSVYVWVLSIPAAYLLSRYTGVTIVWLYVIVKSLDIVKCIIGYVLLKKRVWVNNIVV